MPEWQSFARYIENAHICVGLIKVHLLPPTLVLNARPFIRCSSSWKMLDFSHRSIHSTQNIPHSPRYCVSPPQYWSFWCVWLHIWWLWWWWLRRLELHCHSRSGNRYRELTMQSTKAEKWSTRSIRSREQAVKLLHACEIILCNGLFLFFNWFVLAVLMSKYFKFISRMIFGYSNFH